MLTEKEKMLLGKIYDPAAEDLPSLRENAHDLCKEYNNLKESDPRRNEIIKELFPDSEGLNLTGPIFFDYGIFTKFGRGCYANFNFTVLDCAPVNIGKSVFFGVNVSLLTPVHPFIAKERNLYFNEKDGCYTDMEYAKPITIGDNCWIASNVVVIGGVTIGEGCVIGAGSVVTRDIPPHSFAAGNPCRVIREIDESDSIYLRKELW